MIKVFIDHGYLKGIMWYDIFSLRVSLIAKTAFIAILGLYLAVTWRDEPDG